MTIRGEVIIITSKGSKLSEEPILIRLIAEFRSIDNVIKTFCFNNDLNVRLDKDGNYMIDLSEQLGFTVLTIEDGLVYLSLPKSMSEKEKEKLEKCASFFKGNNSAILYYYDPENKEEFCHKILYGSDLRKMNFVKDHLQEYTKIIEEKTEGEKVLKKRI